MPDPARASVVEISFEGRDGGGTHVTLEHSGFEHHGTGATEYQAAMASPQGWPYILQRFADAAT